jgi:amino acid transporter
MAMTAPTEPAQPRAPGAETGPGTATLEKDAIGLGRSTIFAMAGAAPGQTVAITLAILVSASAYGTILPVILTTAGLLCIALAFHRLNMWRQNAGATYEWVSRAFSPYVGFLVGWLMLVAFTLFVLIDVITIGPSVLALLGLSPSNKWAGAVAIILIGSFLTLTAVRGIRLSARLQVVVALLEYSIVTVFSVWAFISVFIVRSAGTVHPTTQWLTFHGTGAGVFGASMIIAVASLSGWDGGIYLNEETQAPEKNPGRGAVLGVALTGLLFLIMYGTYQGVGPSAQLQAHSANAIAWVGQTLAGTAGDRIMSFAVVISVLATTQVAIIGTSRVAYSMARDRVLPRRLGSISPSYRTPAFATLVLGGATIVLAIIDIFATSVSSAMTTIINTSGVLYSIFYAVTGIAAAWYYRRLLLQSAKNAIMLGLLPLAGAALLIWVTVKGTQALNQGEKNALIVIAVLGVIMMVVAARVYRAPIFKARIETAETAEAVSHFGADPS